MNHGLGIRLRVLSIALENRPNGSLQLLQFLLRLLPLVWLAPQPCLICGIRGLRTRGVAGYRSIGVPERE